MAADGSAEPAPSMFRIGADALKPENNNLTLVRLVLASAVILSHCFWRQTLLEETDWFSPWLGAPVSRFAVDGFFFLSGFLVFRSLGRQASVKRFLLARLARMYPALLTAVIGTVVIGMFLTTADLRTYFTGETLNFIFGNLSFVKAQYFLTDVYCDSYVSLCSVNGSLWTLPWEMRCYLALALMSLLGLASQRAMAKAVLPATIAFAVAWQIPDIQMAVQTHLPTAVYWVDKVARLWTLFAVGCAAAIWRERIPLHGGILAILFVVNLLAAHTAFDYTARLLLIAYAVLYVGFRPLPVTRQISQMPDYSYGIYIYAYPVMALIAAWRPDSGPAELALLNLLGVLPIAALSWHYVEKPVLDGFRRWSKRSAYTVPAEPNTRPASDAATGPDRGRVLTES